MSAHAGRSQRAGAGGHSLPELLAAIALLGMLVVMTAPLTTYLLHQGSVERLRGDDFVLSFGVVPALREDARRTVAAGRRLLGLNAGRGGLVLDFGEEVVGGRAVVYRVEPGLLRRTLYREEGGRLRPGPTRVWRGGFAVSLGVERLERGDLVALEAFSAGEAQVSFRFGLRR